MAVAFRIAGSITVNSTTTTLTLTAPSTGVTIGDLFIASVIGKNNQTVTPPGGWNTLSEYNNTTGMRTSLFWRVVESGDAGATFNFTKPTDDNLFFAGLIYCFSGTHASAPIDATTPSQSPNATSDTVTYADFNPTETNAYVVALGQYAQDLTTAGTISGTNPTLGLLDDQETSTGSDGSFFLYGGTSDGSATGARSHSTTATTDTINTGTMFGLVALADINQAITGSAGTTAVGSLVAAVTIALSGVFGTGSVGTVGVDLAATATGVSATASPGSLGSERTVPLTGEGATGEVGSVTYSAGGDLSRPLTGVSATASVGSLGVSSDIPLSGTPATGAIGSLGPSTAVPIAGVAATSAVGTVVYSATGDLERALTGVAASAVVGTVTVSGAVSLDPLIYASRVVGVSVKTTTAAETPTSVLGLVRFRVKEQVGAESPIVSYSDIGA